MDNDCKGSSFYKRLNPHIYSLKLSSAGDF